MLLLNSYFLEANDQYFEDSFQLVTIIYRIKEGEPVTDAEQQLLDSWLTKNPANQSLFNNLLNSQFQLSALREVQAFDIPAFSAALVNKVTTPTPVRRLFTPLTRKIAIAAAAMAVVAGAYYNWHTGNNKATNAVTTTVIATTIKGASNKATLTLSNGQVVTLDSLQNGQFSNQGGTAIAKSAEALVYNNKGNTVLINTLTTPRGGKFKVVLADGTTVWMNSASALTYPTAFIGSNRTVQLKGEAYFEVAKNTAMPFIVQVNDLNVKVTGTHFNINSYADENTITTTLFEGGVQVSDHNNTQLLIPGQQAIADKTTHTLVKEKANLRQVLSWKDGLFIFDGKQKSEILRELSRWYNIDIEDKAGANQTTYSGVINRNLPLDELLDVLRESKVLNGQLVQGKLVILP